MPIGDWWTNWGFTSSGAQTAAGSNFLATGNVGTPIGGTQCRASNECASGYACVNGRCEPKPSLSSTDGSTSGCGGSGGGGGGCFDGSTGCTTPSCGNGEGGDCCGPRYCRYDQNGNVSCGCGEAPSGACTVFCDSYLASFGAGAAGCEGKVCDECATCDGNYFSSTYNTCVPVSGGPCHCDPGSLPECYKCNEQGTTELDTSCKECYTTNVDCDCGEIFQKTCCYTLEELKNGLTGYNRCAESVDCSEVCGDRDYVDPCEGECTPQKIGPLPGTCQDVTDQISVADGHRVVGTGCIEAGGQATVLYNDCDMTNVPESCKECDCNCDNDCPYCQVCNESTGKCVQDANDPNCVEQIKTSTWVVPGTSLTSGSGKYRTCTFNATVCNEYNFTPIEVFDFYYTTPIAGPTPHSVSLLEDTREFRYGCYDINTGGCTCSYLPGGCYGDAAPYSGTMSESVVIRYRVKDADGNTLGDINAFVLGNSGRVTVQPAVNAGGAPYLESYN